MFCQKINSDLRHWPVILKLFFSRLWFVESVFTTTMNDEQLSQKNNIGDIINAAMSPLRAQNLIISSFFHQRKRNKRKRNFRKLTNEKDYKESLVLCGSKIEFSTFSLTTQLTKSVIEVISNCSGFTTDFSFNCNGVITYQMRHLIYSVIILLAFVINAFSHPISASFEEPLKNTNLEKKSFDSNETNSRQKTFANKGKLIEFSFVLKRSDAGQRPKKRRAARQSGLMNRHKRLQRLATKSGFYVEIRKKGKVKGTTRRASPYSELNVFTNSYNAFTPHTRHA